MPRWHLKKRAAVTMCAPTIPPPPCLGEGNHPKDGGGVLRDGGRLLHQLRWSPSPSEARGGFKEHHMATSPDPIVILSYARTPMGSFQGALSGASATELGATAVKAAVERAGLSGEPIDKVFM